MDERWSEREREKTRAHTAHTTYLHYFICETPGLQNVIVEPMKWQRPCWKCGHRTKSPTDKWGRPLSVFNGRRETIAFFSVSHWTAKVGQTEGACEGDEENLSFISSPSLTFTLNSLLHAFSFFAVLRRKAKNKHFQNFNLVKLMKKWRMVTIIVCHCTTEPKMKMLFYSFERGDGATLG